MTEIKNKTILIVDDQQFVRSIVKSMLQQVGISKVIEATDGSHALLQVDTHNPDLVICDVQMRPTDGFSFVQHLRQQEKTANMPVIMLTAHSDSSTSERARGLHIDAFISKPVLPGTLSSTITQVLTRREQGI